MTLRLIGTAKWREDFFGLEFFIADLQSESGE